MFGALCEMPPVTRIVVHCDMDAFYANVEIALDPTLKDLPVAVCQYNPRDPKGVKTISSDKSRKLPTSESGLIAVSYKAREFGVKRSMTAADAKKICPELQLVQVPTKNGKADLQIYRDAGQRVVEQLHEDGITERASIDEAYIDISAKARKMLAAAQNAKGEGGQNAWAAILQEARSTKVAGVAATAGAAAVSRKALRWGHNTKDIEQDEAGDGEGDDAAKKEHYDKPVVTSEDWFDRPSYDWTEDDKLLTCGAVIVSRMRRRVTAATGYTCSAGVSFNKLLAKMGSAMHKPDQQTVLPASTVESLMQNLPLDKIKGLGGDFGKKVCATLNVTTAGEVAAVSKRQLEKLFGEKNGGILYDACRGIDATEVKDRQFAKSIVCGKTFAGNSCLRSPVEVKRWLGELSNELDERMQKEKAQNQRIPQKGSVSFTESGSQISRAFKFRFSREAIVTEALAQVTKYMNSKVHSKSLAITTLYLTVGDFQDVSNCRDITSMFSRAPVPEFGKEKEKEEKDITGQQNDGHESDDNVALLYAEDEPAVADASDAAADRPTSPAKPDAKLDKSGEHNEQHDGGGSSMSVGSHSTGMNSPQPEVEEVVELEVVEEQRMASSEVARSSNEPQDRQHQREEVVQEQNQESNEGSNAEQRNEVQNGQARNGQSSASRVHACPCCGLGLLPEMVHDHFQNTCQIQLDMLDDLPEDMQRDVKQLLRDAKQANIQPQPRPAPRKHVEVKGKRKPAKGASKKQAPPAAKSAIITNFFSQATAEDRANESEWMSVRPPPPKKLKKEDRTITRFFS